MEIATNNNLIKESKQLHLSTQASAGTLKNGEKRSCIEYYVPNFIQHDDSIEYIQYSVQSAIIPVSFYTINDNHNSLVVTVSSVTTTYTFPNGNYNATLFIAQFKTLLGATFNITLDSATSKFTITNTTNNFTLGAATTIDYIMGFSGDITSSGLTLTMPRVCNFLSLRRINIRCGYLANGVVSSNSTSTIDNDVILSVTNDAVPNGQIVYTDGNNSVNIFRGDKLDTFLVCFTDDEGLYIDFNGVSSYFTLQFDIFRRYLMKPDRFSNIVNKVNSIL
jgi:hypothetical protein